MKLLTEYLSTKVKNVKSIEYQGFPETPIYDDMVKFLEKNGFKHVEIPSSLASYQSVIQFCMNEAVESNVPLYFTSEDIFKDNDYRDSTYIRICNYGKIDKDNPIFLLRIVKPDKLAHFKGHGVGSAEFNISESETIESYSEFVNKINKNFGW